MHGNREIPASSAAKGAADRSVKDKTRTTDAHDSGKSDRPIVPKKPANNAEAAALAAESVEGRGLTKGNAHQAAVLRTQRRLGRSIRLLRVRGPHDRATLRHHPR